MRLTVSLAIACLVGGVSIASDAGAAIRRPTSIPAQNLGEALQALARDCNIQVVYFSTAIDTLETQGAAGEFTTEEAFENVLRGTGFTYRYLGENTITIVPSAQRGPAESDALGSQAKAVQIEEVIVTGSHIRGIENHTAPVTILDKQYIDSTGISTVSGLIQSLPQNFAFNNQSGVLMPGSSGGYAQGAAISLRGLGEGTTLTLLNGRRPALGYSGAAMDISALPLTAIERVEVLTDGASAIYGSDAVGGVVNFVLKKDFDGFETRLRSGWADGVNEYRASQVAGTSWDSGNALLSVEYSRRDLLLARDRDFIPGDLQILSLSPEDRNLGVLLSGRQELTGTVSVFADALYTMRDSFNMTGRTVGWRDVEVENPQISATAGLGWQIGEQWQIELSGTYGKNHQERVLKSDGTRPTDNLFTAPFHVKVGQVKADGPLAKLPGGVVRAAIGADWRTESFSYGSYDNAGNPAGTAGSDDQIVRSAFAEIHVPLIGLANALPAARRVELSLAARYDDYSKFGSSTNPKLGLSWEPVEGLSLRGNWGTSYRAPKLSDYSTAQNAAIAFYVADPGVGGTSRILLVQGTATDELTAEESENLSFGADFTPAFLKGLKLSVNFFSIDYTQRIDSPGSNPSLLLSNPDAFGSLVDRNPTPAKIDRYIAIGNAGQGFLAYTPPPLRPDTNFDPSSIDALLDVRRRNLSAVKAGGVDLALQYGFTLAGGETHLSADATHLRELTRRVTPTSTTVDNVDTFSNPPDWRFRAGAGWARQGWAANVFVNYTDSYTDNRLSPLRTISSYTTVDARLAFDLGRRFPSGAFSGLTLAANVQNLFDEDPPRTAIVSTLGDLGFDSTNASPMGRLIGVELTKNWGR
jgi:iron complex outermembrane recepter protein